MAKYRDVKSAGRSKICPLVKGESAGKRHRRRLKVSMESCKELEDWCKKYGIRLTITNKGHHWRASKGGIAVEWWPSSAKVIINKKWPHGQHVHDWRQFQAILEKRFE